MNLQCVSTLRIALAFNSALCALSLKVPQPEVALDHLKKCKGLLGVQVDSSAISSSSARPGLDAVVSRLTQVALRKRSAMEKISLIEPSRPGPRRKRRHGGPRQKRIVRGGESSNTTRSKSKAFEKSKKHTSTSKGKAKSAIKGDKRDTSADVQNCNRKDDTFDAQALIAAIDRELEIEKVSSMIPYIGRSSYAQHGVRTADTFERERERRKKAEGTKVSTIFY